MKLTITEGEQRIAELEAQLLDKGALVVELRERAQKAGDRLAEAEEVHDTIREQLHGYFGVRHIESIPSAVVDLIDLAIGFEDDAVQWRDRAESAEAKLAEAVAVKKKTQDAKRIEEENTLRILAEFDEVRAHLAEAEKEIDALTFAAHMPPDYQYGLPSWICQRLYRAYIAQGKNKEHWDALKDALDERDKAEARAAELVKVVELVAKETAPKGKDWYLSDCAYDQLLETILQTHEIAQAALAHAGQEEEKADIEQIEDVIASAIAEIAENKRLRAALKQVEWDDAEPEAQPRIVKTLMSQNGQVFALYLSNGQKIKIRRKGMAAWMEIGPIPIVREAGE